VLPWQHWRKREPAFSHRRGSVLINYKYFMLNQCLENTCEGLLHACISSYALFGFTFIQEFYFFSSHIAVIEHWLFICQNGLNSGLKNTIIRAIIWIGNHAMATCRVQLGINTTSEVWKFCQNWTSRRGESNLANFQTSRVLLIPNCTSNIAWLLVYLLARQNWILLNVNIIYSLAKSQFRQTFNQNLVLLSVFSFSSFVKAKFGAFVRIFI
jgi:hypothetical protein